VNGALLELAWLTFRGRIVRRLRLLRQPRYLLASLFGAAYFLFFVVRQLRSWQTLRGQGSLAPRTLALLPWGIGLGIALLATLVWAFASAKPALRLSEAEIHFLLPAPLSRRQILAYALWKQQIGVLTGAVLLVFLRGAGPPGQRFSRFFATWALFTLFDLHLKGVNLWKARLAEISRPAARFQAVAVVAVALAFWGLLLGSLWRIARGFPAGSPFDPGVLSGIAAAAVAGLPGRLLTPFAWIGRPLLGDLAGGALVLYLLGLLFVHFEWVLRSRGRFEEAALERARRQLERAERFRRGGGRRRPAASSRHREPFALPPTGRPELAIFWKNLTLSSRRPLRWRAGVLAALFAALLGAALAFGPSAAIVGILSGIGIPILVLMPPFCGMFLRNDLRTDLRELETLRPWPIPGWRLLGAELLAPATMALTILASGYGLVLIAGISAVTWAGRTPEALAALRIFPGNLAAGPVPLLVLGYGSVFLAGLAIALLSIALQNVATLLLPVWLGSTPQSRRGAAVTGQHLLILLAHTIGLLAGLFVPIFLLSLVLLVQWHFDVDLTYAEGPLLALLVILPVLAEVALLVRLGGARWDALDPSREILDREE
jgi:ABC-2 type transport system permease protein